MNCSLPGSSLHGISQARVLEWVAISFSRGSSQLRDRIRVSRNPGRRFNLWATREAKLKKKKKTTKWTMSVKTSHQHHSEENYLPCTLRLSSYNSRFSNLNIFNPQVDMDVGRSKLMPRDFPGDPVVKTPCFHCKRCRFNSWSGNYDPACCMAWPKKSLIN